MMGDTNRQLGNYRILEMLGHGGFADVYLGEHIYLHTQAAIKVLRTQLTSEDIEQFRNEALLIAHLTHPHIIRVLDFDVENAVPFLVMDYAPGGTLRQRIPHGMQTSPRLFIPYVQQVASALQYAHDQKLIHRDVKPANMLLAADGEVKLSDFGIALVARSTLSQETTGDVIGTMTYMAPEQLQGKARPASDQYALAVVIYEWLTGVLPFRGSYMEIITQHLSAPPPPIDEQSLSIPHAVTQVLWKALAKDPHDRFPRVEDFANALAHAYDTGKLDASLVAQVAARPMQASENTVPQAPARAVPMPISPQQASENTVPLAPAHPVPMPISPQAATIPDAAGLIPPSRPVQRVIQEPVSPPQEEHDTPPAIGRRFARKATHKAKGCAYTVVLLCIVLPLLLCGLGFGGYNYLTNRNSPTQAAALADNFIAALASRNYDQAYNDLGSSITNSTSHDAFILQAQTEDRCYGQIIGNQQTGASSPNGTQVYNYTVTRTKLTQPYHFHVTVSKDWLGNWSITDYNSDAGVGLPACH